MAKVEFTQSEYILLAYSLAQLMLMRKEVTAREWDKPQNKVLKELANKFTDTQEGEVITVHMQRRHLRLVEEVTMGGLQAVEKTIVNYQERAKIEKLDPTMFDKYIMRARRTKELLESIKERIQWML